MDKFFNRVGKSRGEMWCKGHTHNSTKTKPSEDEAKSSLFRTSCKELQFIAVILLHYSLRV